MIPCSLRNRTPMNDTIRSRPVSGPLISTATYFRMRQHAQILRGETARSLLDSTCVLPFRPSSITGLSCLYFFIGGRLGLREKLL